MAKPDRKKPAEAAEADSVEKTLVEATLGDDGVATGDATGDGTGTQVHGAAPPATGPDGVSLEGERLYDVSLTAFVGERIALVKELRDILAKPLREVEDLLAELPQLLLKAVPYPAVLGIAERITKAGGTVDVHPSAVEPRSEPSAAPAASAPAGTTEAPKAAELPPDAPNDANAVVPTLKEWTDAGYAEPAYYRRFGKNPTPNTEAAQPEAAAAPAPAVAPAPAAGKRRYKVWSYGDLHRNGEKFAPGEPIDLTDAEAETLNCVSLAE